MGSVPNCQKEIADCYPIRWFKCKLKPPKNGGRAQVAHTLLPGWTKNVIISHWMVNMFSGGRIVGKHFDDEFSSGGEWLIIDYKIIWY